MFQQAKPNPFALPPQQLGIEPTQFNIPAPKPGGGMFGGGGKKILSTIAEALAAYSAGMGNPAGMAVLQGMNHRRQSAADAETQEQQYQRQQRDQWEMWQRKQDYERQNPTPRPPTQTDRYVEEIMNPQTDPRRRELLRGIVMNPIASVVNGADGSQRTDYIYPGMDTPPATGEDEWEYNDGGPRPLGVGGFPGY